MEHLILQIAGASVSGFVLFALTSIAGNGLAVLLRLPPGEADLLPIQYLFGIATVSLLAWMALYGWIGPLASVMVLAGLAYAGRNALSAWPHVRRAAFLGMPVALLLALWLGLQFHGPSAGLGGSPMGDTVWYATRTLFMVRDPGFTADFFAEGFKTSLFLGPRTPMIIGAALIRFGLADPFLFLSVTMTLCMGLWLAAIADQAWRSGFAQASPESGANPTLFIVIALMTAAPGYLYWIFESPPVSAVLPLAAIPVAMLARRDFSLRSLVWVALVWALFLCQSKLTAFSFIGPALLLPFLLIVGRTLGKVYAWSAIGLMAALLLAVGILLIQRNQGYVGMTGLNTVSWWPSMSRLSRGSSPAVGVVTLLGYAACLALILRLERAQNFLLGLLLPGLCAVILALYIPTTALICYKTLLIFIAVTILARVRRLSAVELMLAAIVAAAMFVEEFKATGPRGAFADILFAGLLIAPAFSRRVPSVLRPGLVAIWAAPGLLCLGAVCGLLFVSPLRNYAEHKVHWLYSPDTYAVYDAVDRLTPPDSLVFTDQTGESVDLQHGWNSYPAMGRRQTYISNWYEVPPLEVKPAEVSRRLKFNQDVLAGKIAPATVGLSRGYAGYYAVVRRDRKALGPVLYANSSFMLYRIDPRGPAS